MTAHTPALEYFESSDRVAAETARLVLSAADEAIARHGRFTLVLAGGRTPLAAYTLLADAGADWERWHIFLGDERCLPVHDPERNSRAIGSAFLDRAPIPPGNRHLIPAEWGAEAAAAAYSEIVASALPFDLVLLGMGEDGHTASLFPGHPFPPEGHVVPVHNAPKPPPERVSLTPRALAAARGMLILVTGAGKRDALADWCAGADLPVARVAALGPARVLVDRDAGGEGCREGA